MVKKLTEDVFDQQLKAMKLPGIKRVGFKQLTFGDAPFRVESIHVSDKRTVGGGRGGGCCGWCVCGGGAGSRGV